MKLVNIFNDYRKLHLFIRDEEGLKIRVVNSFFPYFYEPDPNGTIKSYDGKGLKKILVSSPADIPKERTSNSYEADIFFTRRYMIDKVDILEECPVKYAFIDIEVLADELPSVKAAKYPVSCVSIYNSESEKIQTFYLPDYENEHAMITDFINYMKKEQFDIWFSWNVKFDYNYLVNRFPDFGEKISIIGQTRYGDGDVFYPAGISIVDYLAWFKKVTMNKERSYALDAIAVKHLGEEANETVEFGTINPKIKEKNINDVNRMAKLEKEFKIIPYFDEIRRMAKVEWEDMIWNSRVIDMLLLEEAKNQKLVLPVRPKENEKENYEGAYREIFESGAIFGCESYDLSSAYPSMIVDFCLDPTNILKDEVAEELISQPVNSPADFKLPLLIEKGYFNQNPGALLPTVTKKLMILKDGIKKELSKIPIGTPEYKNMKSKYNAIKGVVNSAYGVFGNRFFRLYNKQIASATTFLVRDLLHYVEEKIKDLGYKILYVDTDGIMIKGNDTDISDVLNQFVNQWAKEKYGKDEVTTSFSYEGRYEKILLLAKCRYLGYLKTDKGVEEKVVGVESKRKDSTIFMKKFHRTLMDKILDKVPKAEIITWIKTQAEVIKKAPIHEISLPCKLGRQPEEYKNTPIFLRALRNTEGFEKKVGEPYYYIFMEGKDSSKKEMVLAFDEDNSSHIDRDKINWDKLIDRNIYKKLVTIFDAMKWDIKEV